MLGNSCVYAHLNIWQICVGKCKCNWHMYMDKIKSSHKKIYFLFFKDKKLKGGAKMDA